MHSNMSVDSGSQFSIFRTRYKQ